jgi:hypothetical protein
VISTDFTTGIWNCPALLQQFPQGNDQGRN